MSSAPVPFESQSTYPGPAPPGLYCSVGFSDMEASWVSLDGELDISTIALLTETLSECIGRSRLVVLDLRRLDFMDSTGVHALDDASEAARNAGVRLVVLRGGAHVERVFELTGFSRVLEEIELDDGSAPVPDGEPRLTRAGR